MRKLRLFWKSIPRKRKITINLLMMALIGALLYLFLGCPAFTAEQRYRRAAKAHMVGPGEILGIFDPEGSNYQHVLVAEEQNAVIFYLYSDVPGSMEDLYYREKTGRLTVLASPNILPGSFGAQVLELPVFLFDDYPEALRAELEITLSETVNDEYYEKTYHLESPREADGYFHFHIHAEAEGSYTDIYGFELPNELGAEGIVLRQFSQMCGYDDSFNLQPQPVTVRLYDKNDSLILEEIVQVRCVKDMAHQKQNDPV